jgi:hypothetical protein
MKTNGKHEVLAQIVRRGLLLVPLLVMVVSVAPCTHAQSNGTSATALAEKPAAATVTATQAPNVVAKPAAASANAPASAEEKPSRKGAQEGIQVHGHWTIEVRNPDGTVDKHLDFENGFCTLSNTIGVNAISTGDLTLAGLLTGLSVPGPWQIQLASPAVPAGGAPVPACSKLINTSNEFILDQSNATSLVAGCSAGLLCFPVLTPPTLTSSNNGIILSGQFTIPAGTSNTTITAVLTTMATCPSSSYTLSTCTANSSTLSPFSGTYLTGIGSVPAAPTVTAGQTVAVSVQYSFQ